MISRDVRLIGNHYLSNIGGCVKLDGASVRHAYTVEGEHTVHLIVDGVDGIPAEKTFKVNVSGSAVNTLFTPTENKRWTPPAKKPPAAAPKTE